MRWIAVAALCGAMALAVGHETWAQSATHGTGGGHGAKQGETRAPSAGHASGGHGAAQAPSADHASGGHGAAPAGPGCASPVRLSAQAERRAGGADYVPPPGETAAAAAAASGAHDMHGTQFGGYAFFMAPDKVHHIEALYSEECGFRVAVFNAFTEPVAVARFRGFMRATPADRDHLEQLRFLAPNADGSLLEARFAEPPPRPFEVELYVEFPGDPEPVLFNVAVPAAAH